MGAVPSKIEVRRQFEKTEGLTHYTSELKFNNKPSIDLLKNFSGLNVINGSRAIKINDINIHKKVAHNFVSFLTLNNMEQKNSNFAKFLINSDETKSHIFEIKDFLSHRESLQKSFRESLRKNLQPNDRISILDKFGTTYKECVYFGKVGEIDQLCCFKWENNGIYFTNLSNLLSRFSNRNQPYIFVYRPSTLFCHGNWHFTTNLKRTYANNINQFCLQCGGALESDRLLLNTFREREFAERTEYSGVSEAAENYHVRKNIFNHNH